MTDETLADELSDMADLVMRDRSHPSIVIWSLCNEVGCRNESAAAAFRAAVLAHDTTRPITQNHLGAGQHPLSMASLDVQGFSHRTANIFDAFHQLNPRVPMVASECCSCLSQRGEDTEQVPRDSNPRRPSHAEPPCQRPSHLQPAEGRTCESRLSQLVPKPATHRRLQHRRMPSLVRRR